MLKSTFVLILLIGSIFISNTFAQLDPTFNGSGKKLISFTASGTTKDMVVQPDNKIIIIGNCNEVGALRPFCVIRLNEDGTFDTSFGNNNGYVFPIINGSTPFFGSQGVVLQNDGKIVLAGTVTSRLTLIRLNPNGSADTTFGTQGIVQNTQVTQANKIALQSDQKFVVVGSSGSNSKLILARYLSNGTIDNSFGVNGIAAPDISTDRTLGASLDIQPDGKIVTGGAVSGATTSYLLARFNRNGSLDLTFDDDGFLTIDSGANFYPESGNLIAVAVKSDGRIVALGDRNVLFSFNANGSPDITFNGDGSRAALSDGEPYDLAVKASGKIIVAGNPVVPTNYPNINYRSSLYLANGTNDPKFAVGDIDLSGIDGATSVLIDRKGRAFLSGRSSFGTVHDAPWALPIFSAARLLAPPTQNVGFSGKVVDLDGKPVLNALIVLKDGANVIANSRTNPFGNFRFNNVATNQTYTITTIAKGKNFYDRSVMIDDETANFLIVGE